MEVRPLGGQDKVVTGKRPRRLRPAPTRSPAPTRVKVALAPADAPALGATVYVQPRSPERRAGRAGHQAAHQRAAAGGCRLARCGCTTRRAAPCARKPVQVATADGNDAVIAGGLQSPACRWFPAGVHVLTAGPEGLGLARKNQAPETGSNAAPPAIKNVVAIQAAAATSCLWHGRFKLTRRHDRIPTRPRLQPLRWALEHAGADALPDGGADGCWASPPISSWGRMKTRPLPFASWWCGHVLARRHGPADGRAGDRQDRAHAAGSARGDKDPQLLQAG
jgi:hypothetical protein